jgi:hypothetical protein
MGRTGGGLFIAILVVAAVGAGYLAVSSGRQASTSTSTSQGASTSISSTSGAAVTTNGTSGLYRVKFLQESNCPYGSWLVPWAVAINNQTVVQPSNATLPLSYNGTRLTGESNYSAIWFSLPNGTYGYTIIPNDPMGSAQSGQVTVNGSNLMVQVYAFITAMGCSSTTTVAGANPAVATVTVTTTLTTQASKATTTYAIPTTNCTIMPVITTTTTTITVGPTPPVSTTTTTVTTTSTSYTQTVTVTSCTYSAPPMVTSTVTTTTATP